MSIQKSKRVLCVPGVFPKSFAENVRKHMPWMHIDTINKQTIDLGFVREAMLFAANCASLEKIGYANLVEPDKVNVCRRVSISPNLQKGEILSSRTLPGKSVLMVVNLTQAMTSSAMSRYAYTGGAFIVDGQRYVMNTMSAMFVAPDTSFAIEAVHDGILELLITDILIDNKE